MECATTGIASQIWSHLSDHPDPSPTIFFGFCSQGNPSDSYLMAAVP